LKYLENAHLDELLFYLENNEESTLLHQICLIILMKIIVGSYFGENNEYNCFVMSAEIININGIDRMINIFNKYSNNYLKLFISIIICSFMKNLPLSKRFSFIYSYLKNYLIFYHNKYISSSSSSSSSPLCFPESQTFSNCFIENKNMEEDINHFDTYFNNYFYEFGNVIKSENNELDISNKKEKFKSFMDSMFLSINNEKILFYCIYGLFSISTNENNYKNIIVEDLYLLMKLLYFFYLKSNNETKSIIISIIYNIIKHETDNYKNEIKLNELNEKTNIINYLIETIKNENDNYIIEITLKCLLSLFIFKNSSKFIKLLMEKKIILLLEKIIKSIMNNLLTKFNDEKKNSKIFFEV
jgi:hypothetical protein